MFSGWRGVYGRGNSIFLAENGTKLHFIYIYIYILMLKLFRTPAIDYLYQAVWQVSTFLLRVNAKHRSDIS
jgi:hypothetical protein